MEGMEENEGKWRGGKVERKEMKRWKDGGKCTYGERDPEEIVRRKDGGGRRDGGKAGGTMER